LDSICRIIWFVKHTLFTYFINTFFYDHCPTHSFPCILVFHCIVSFLRSCMHHSTGCFALSRVQISVVSIKTLSYFFLYLLHLRCAFRPHTHLLALPKTHLSSYPHCFIRFGLLLSLFHSDYYYRSLVRCICIRS
jgi:hypothetical protein